MTYTKKTWASGEVIDAPDMQNIEDGIEAVHDEAVSLAGVKTFTAIPVVDIAAISALELKTTSPAHRISIRNNAGKIELYDNAGAALKIADIILHAHSGGTGGAQISHGDLSSGVNDHHLKLHPRNSGTVHAGKEDPENVDDYSANLPEMKTEADPYPLKVADPAVDLTGEIGRIRYQLTKILGTSFWYENIPLDLTVLAAHAARHQDDGEDELLLETLGGELTDALHGVRAGASDHSNNLSGKARSDYKIDGSLIGTRRALNLIAGNGINLDGADDSPGEEVDLTVSTKNAGIRDKFVMEEDFWGDSLDARWKLTKDGAMTADIGGNFGGGFFRFIASLNSGGRINWDNKIILSPDLNVSMEMRIRHNIRTVDDTILYMGLVDVDFDTSSPPSTTDHALIAADLAGTNYFIAFGNTSGNNSEDLGVALVADVWQLYRLDITTSDIKVYRNGSLIHTTTTDLPAEYMMPYFGMEWGAGVDLSNFDIDYVYIEQDRET